MFWGLCLYFQMKPTLYYSIQHNLVTQWHTIQYNLLGHFYKTNCIVSCVLYINQYNWIKWRMKWVPHMNKVFNILNVFHMWTWLSYISLLLFWCKLLKMFMEIVKWCKHCTKEWFPTSSLHINVFFVINNIHKNFYGV